jgi:6-phosphogluconolactonase
MRFQAFAILAGAALVMGAANTARFGEALPPANHVLYTMTNAAGGNEVQVYSRHPGTGLLTFVAAVATGGNGTGTGLGSQGALILTEDRRYVLAVNAGSNTISSLEVMADGLTLVETEPSGGTMPVSITECNGTVYVLNSGGAGNISGFTLGSDGTLTPIAGSTQPLSGAVAPNPAQIGFSPDCDWLVVTEKNSDTIDVYPVDSSGVAGTPVVNVSAGPTPFGFSFDSSGLLVVSEAHDGNAGESTVSSYTINANGTLTIISNSVPTTETSACWIALAKNGKYAYTTNTGSASITGYSIGNQSGTLTRLDANGVTAQLGPTAMPIDLATTASGRFLYVLIAGTNAIRIFEIHADGSLTAVEDGAVLGLPVGTAGLVIA